jgi:DNA-binding CsgD family transcriptional regulator
MTVRAVTQARRTGSDAISSAARRLIVSEATVKTHINHAFGKAGVRDRAQAVAYAYRTGLARP